MPASYIPTRCVNQCPPVFIRVGISIQKRVDSHLDKTRPAALKIWSFPISNEQNQNVKLKASLQQAHKRKMTASVLVAFVLIGTLYLKLRVAFTTPVLVKSCFLLSLEKMFNVLLYLQMRPVCRKTHRVVEYTPKKCFNSFEQSAVDARRQSDENSNSSVVAKTRKLLANSSYGCQIMNRSRHTVTKYLSDENTHAANNSKLFKKLDHMNNSLYEVELSKAGIEHKAPIIVGSSFFNTQNCECWSFTTTSSLDTVM